MNQPHMRERSTLEVQLILNEYFAAWRDRDPARIVARHTPDTSFELHIGTPAVKGRPAVEATFAGFFRQWPGFTFIAHRVIVGASHWVLDYTMTATAQRHIDGRTVDREIRVHCLDVVELSPEGLVARKDTFVDAAQLRAAMA
jgi:ketosteroid isomerase-like protein